MSTNKTRFIITVEDEMAKAIEDYHYENRFKNRTKAIIALLQIALDDVSKTNPTPKPQSAPIVEESAPIVAPELDLDNLLAD